MEPLVGLAGEDVGELDATERLIVDESLPTLL